MFGSSGSPPKDEESHLNPKPETTPETMSQEPSSISIPDATEDAPQVDPKSPNADPTAGGKPPLEDVGNPAAADKRSRRSSGFGNKAKDMLSNAKQSFLASPTRSNSEKAVQSPIQRLGKTDPALIVPQGSFNNAAGESAPGPRSTFRVGVTEDKNKKCRRTMEDTHAYLYNFLNTPAPSLVSDTSSAMSKVQSSALDTQSSASSTGSGRPVVETDNGYFAIFDGHAGTFAAEWCGKKLHIILEDTIRKNPNKPIPELLDETFTNVDQQLEKLPLKNSGSTAVIAVLRWEDRIPNAQSATGSTAIAPEAAAAVAKEGPPSEQPQHDHTGSQSGAESKLREAASRQRVLYTANVGDARIVLCRNGKALRLSYDHKGSDDNEGKRIANAGGLILNNRVNGVLAVTRALGDAYMKDLITGHPYTTETVIQPDIDEFLILACDGLWDVCSDQEAVDLVRKEEDPQTASKLLVEHALARFSTDNLSCMVVRFNTRALQDAVSARVEPIGVEGDAPSRVAGGITEAEAILDAAKKNTPVGPVGESEDDVVNRLSHDMIAEEAADQEPGPELDPSGLEQAKEKAAEAKKELNTGLRGS